MLEGVVVKDLKRFVDERGFFNEVFRKDWNEIFSDEIVQVNMSITYPGIVRAWHRHLRGQVDYFYVVDGTLKLCCYDDLTRELCEFVLTEMQPRIVRIPGKYWHGFKAIGVKPVILIYFVSRLYDYKNPDEERMAWNDNRVIPELINGKKDERCGKIWDWYASANK
ncbi:MAG: dTDP-4-dehydrorhamnose 3,5-epimerase family protein [Thermoplasmata archaeon]